MSVLFEYFAQRAGVEFVEELLNLPGFKLNSRMIDHADIYHDENEIIELKNRIEKKSQPYLDFLVNACETQCNTLVKKTMVSSLKTPIGAFNLYCEEQMKIMAFLPVFPAAIDPIITNQLDEITQKYATTEFPKDKLTEILQNPSKPFTITKEELNIYKLGALIQDRYSTSEISDLKSTVLDDDTIINEVKQHLANFGWIETRHFKGSFWTIDTVVNRINNILKEDCKEKYEMITNTLKTQETEIASVYSELKFSNSDQDKIKTIRDLIYLRTHRKDAMSEAAYNIRWALEDIAGKAGLKTQDLTYLMPDEIRDLASNSSKSYNKKIEKRKQGFTLMTYEGVTSIFTDENNSKRTGTELDQNMVIGTPTYLDDVRGSVRKILKKSQIQSIQYGEIVVTPMTSPDYIVNPTIMDRIKGIVTDEGGITCHAAHLSREYNIPCIIGTQYATSVFNTGDRIHLNATAGHAKK